MLRRSPGTSLAPCSFLLQTGWQEGDLLLLVLAGIRLQGHRCWAAALDGWAAALDGWAAALDRRAAARDAGAAMLQRQGMQNHGRTGVLHGTLVHSPPGLATLGLLTVQGWAVLLQRPAVDFHRWGADGLHVAHLYSPPGLAEIAALLWRPAALRQTRLHGLAASRLTLAGPLSVAAEAAGVVARAQVRGARGGLVAAAGGTVLRPALLTTDIVARVLVAVAFEVHPVAELAKPSGTNSLGTRKKPTNFFLLFL